MHFSLFAATLAIGLTAVNAAPAAGQSESTILARQDNPQMILQFRDDTCEDDPQGATQSYVFGFICQEEGCPPPDSLDTCYKSNVKECNALDYYQPDVESGAGAYDVQVYSSSDCTGDFFVMGDVGCFERPATEGYVSSVYVRRK